MSLLKGSVSARIHQIDQPRIITAIQNLSDEPRPSGCGKLSDRQAWSLRIGDYREQMGLDSYSFL